MKNKFYVWIAALGMVMAAGAMTGCNKDRDGGGDVNMAEVTGNYQGRYKLMDILPLGEEDTEIIIKEKDAAHTTMDIGVTIQPYDGTVVGLGGTFVNRITRSGDRHTLEASTESVELDYALAGIELPLMKRDVKVGGIVEGRELQLTITMPLPERVIDVLIEAVPDETAKTALRAFMSLIPVSAAGDKLVPVMFVGRK